MTDEILTGNVDGLSTGKMHPGRDQSKLGVWSFFRFALATWSHLTQKIVGRWIETMDYRMIIVVIMLKLWCFHVDLTAISGVSPRR
jgi:hypothetical protein